VDLSAYYDETKAYFLLKINIYCMNIFLTN